MKKIYLLVSVVCIISVLFGVVFIFVLDDRNNICKITDTEPKTVNMNAQEFIDATSFTTKMSGGNMKWMLDYEGLNAGDTLILTDVIYNITYTTFMYNATTILFDVEDYTRLGINASEVIFLFEDDLTDKYQIGDEVEITITVMHFDYTNESSNISIDFEVFEEGWDPESFISHFLTQILPERVLRKIL
jgi:hypothetical protein